MRKSLVALAFLSSSVFSTAGQAQDWTGLYVGAHAGYGSADWGVDVSHTTGALIYNDFFENGDLSDDGGFLGGIQAGANYQTGALVVGLEADVTWANLEADGTFISTGGPGRGGCPTGTHCTRWDISSDLEALGTIRGRVGFTTGNALIYGTGGLAWGRVDTKQATTHNPGAVEVDGARTSGDSNHIGYAIGAGGEYKISSNITVKAEYLYIDLGDADYNLTGTVSPTDPTPWAESFEQDIELHTFRVGVNYLFNN
jgi:outer membrane immunogenic protein